MKELENSNNIKPLGSVGSVEGMDSIKEILLNPEFWDNTYNKMIQKPKISEDDIDLMWKIKEIYKKDIVEDILTGVYQWSIPRKVKIAKAGTTRKRVVYIYTIQDRFVLGALYRALSFMYRDRMSNACFSYKVGVGTNDAILFIRNKKTKDYKYGVKVDIHAYFNSVSKERVVEMLNELFGGNSLSGLHKTMDNLMLSETVIDDGIEVNEWKALIPGCALGSFFANYCLKPLDEYFNDKDCIYARYSDDIIVLAKTQEELNVYLEEIKSKIYAYGLEINPKKYTWFEPGDNVEYLGLKLNDNGKIDISDHARKKIKKQIHRWCRKGRIEIENTGASFDKVAKKIIRRINNKNMFCIIGNETTFGWCHYAFRYINTIESLIEIDHYTRDMIRAMKTGKHNKANVKAITDEQFICLGWVSLVDMFKLYKSDFDYYMEVVELMKNN